MIEWSIVRRTDDDEARACCAFCGQWISLDLIMAHLRVEHDFDADIATWPDGAPVIIDQTLGPDDFLTNRDPGDESAA